MIIGNEQLQMERKIDHVILKICKNQISTLRDNLFTVGISKLAIYRTIFRDRIVERNRWKYEGHRFTRQHSYIRDGYDTNSCCSVSCRQN